MPFEIPRGKTIEDIYNWCCETVEKLNREYRETENREEKNDANSKRNK